MVMTYAFYKRIIDIAVSLPVLLLLLPLLLVIAVAIALESPGSPFFLQARVGRHGRIFRIVKFRSMVKDAPKLGSWQTAKDDPRITRIGKFLRLTSLDELPQLWNVLTGDMSLIGPRPDTPMQKQHYSEADWQLRHRVRPGITGLAQVSGRSHMSPEERLACDLDYARRVSFLLDLSILLRTLRTVLGKDAN